MPNQIYKLRLSLMVKQGSSRAAPKVVNHNRTITTQIARLAGCHVPKGFIVDVEATDMYRRADVTGCRGPLRRCDDGELR